MREPCSVGLWWGQLVISHLWAQEQSSKHLLEIVRTRTDSKKASFLPKRVSGICLPTVAMPFQLYSQPFGMPLSLHSIYVCKHVCTCQLSPKANVPWAVTCLHHHSTIHEKAAHIGDSYWSRSSTLFSLPASI